MFRTGDMYEKTDWFTGGTTTYKCIDRTENTVTLLPVSVELDGIHQMESEIFCISRDEAGREYVLLCTYKGAENRLYSEEV